MRRRVVRVPQESTVRLQLDADYIRTEFARIARRAPRELRRPDPRIYAMYVLPYVEES